MKNQLFLHRLQQEAKFQAELRKHPVLPRHLDFLTSMVGRYPWQIITLTSLITALFWKIL